jgi:hypothetical protein
VSNVDITDPLNNNAPVTAGQFGEASINLDDIPNSNFTPSTCASFGSVLVKTRSSGSGGTSEIKDFILPPPIHVSNCGTVTIVKHALPNGSQPFGFHAADLLPDAPAFNLVDDGTSATRSWSRR